MVHVRGITKKIQDSNNTALTATHFIETDLEK